jgi:hypothetical protein
VRLQPVIEKIRSISAPATGIDQPLYTYINMLRTELQRFKACLPAELTESSMLPSPSPILHKLTSFLIQEVLLSYYQSACITLFELAFRKPSLTTSPPPENTLEQLHLLHSCLESVESCSKPILHCRLHNISTTPSLHTHR